MRALLAIGAAFAFLASGPAMAQACAPAVQAANGPPRKLALVIGIGQYRDPGIADLTGPPNDAALVQGLLTGKFDFGSADVRVLTNERATRAMIVSAICDLVRRARPRDAVVIYYSGHGSRATDQAPIDEPDGFDETIVPYDARGPLGDIRDDEINAMLARLRTDNVTLVLDSCHSGTGARFVGVARLAPPDPRFARPRAVAPSLARRPDSFRQRAARYVMLTGSRADQLSYEFGFPEGQHGALTYYLVRALRGAGPSTSYRDVYERAAAQVASRSPAQTPQIEGPNVDNLLFSGLSAAVRPYVLAHPLGRGARLDAGTVHGATRGSRYAIYAPGTRDFDRATPVSTAEVTKVRTVASEARLLSGRAPAAASRAVETAHFHTGAPLKVFAPLAPNARTALQRLLTQRSAGIELAEVRAEAAMLLDTAGGRYQLRFPDGGAASPAINAGTPDARERLADQLKQWSDWSRLLALSNERSTLSATLSLRRDSQPGAVLGPLVVDEGEEVNIAVTNRSNKSLFLSVLALSSDGSVAVLYPPSGPAESLASGARWQDSFTPELRGKAVVRDTIKAFLTESQIDPRIFTRGDIRGAKAAGQAATGLEQELARASAGARYLSSARSGDWRTLERVVVVRRPS